VVDRRIYIYIYTYMHTLATDFWSILIMIRNSIFNDNLNKNSNDNNLLITIPLLRIMLISFFVFYLQFFPLLYWLLYRGYFIEFRIKRQNQHTRNTFYCYKTAVYIFHHLYPFYHNHIMFHTLCIDGNRAAAAAGQY
jgi:hypothetical protein